MNNVHLAGRAGDGIKIDQRLTEGFFDLGLPVLGPDPRLEPGPSSRAGVAGLAAAVLFHRDLDVEPHQGPDVAHQASVGAQDLHHAPLAGQRGQNLGDPGIAGPGVGVDLLEEGHLVGENGRGQRIILAVKLGVGGAGTIRYAFRRARLGLPAGPGDPLDRPASDPRWRGRSGSRFASDHPQSEASEGS